MLESAYSSAETLYWVLKTHIMQLATAYNSSFRTPNILFWLSCTHTHTHAHAHAHAHTHTHMHTHTHTQLISIFLKGEKNATKTLKIN